MKLKETMAKHWGSNESGVLTFCDRGASEVYKGSDRGVDNSEVGSEGQYKKFDWGVSQS